MQFWPLLLLAAPFATLPFLVASPIRQFAPTRRISFGHWPIPLEPPPRTLLPETDLQAWVAQTEKPEFVSASGEEYHEALQFILENGFLQHIDFDTYLSKWLTIARQLEERIGDRPYMIIMTRDAHLRSTDWLVALAAKHGHFAKNPPIGTFGLEDAIAYLDEHPELDPILAIVHDVAYSGKEIQRTLKRLETRLRGSILNAIQIAVPYMTSMARRRVQWRSGWSAGLAFVGTPELMPSIEDQLSDLYPDDEKARKQAIHHFAVVADKGKLYELWRDMNCQPSEDREQLFQEESRMFDRMISKMTMTSFAHRVPDDHAYFAHETFCEGDAALISQHPFDFFDPRIDRDKIKTVHLLTAQPPSSPSFYPTFDHPTASVDEAFQDPAKKLE